MTPSWARARTRIVPPAGEKWIALVSRLMSTRSIRPASMVTGKASGASTSMRSRASAA
ncbi:hypothetical protein D3C86_2167610 [compost metagenome]